MKKIRSFYVICLITMFNSFPCIAQERLSFDLGSNIPIGDFSNENFFTDETALGATTGFGVGLHYVYPVSDIGPGAFPDADFMMIVSIGFAL